MTAPWFASTLSVGGGKCNDSTLPCYTASAPLPILVARSMAAQMTSRRARGSTSSSTVRHGLVRQRALIVGLHLLGLAAALGVQDELYCFGDFSR